MAFLKLFHIFFLFLWVGSLLTLTRLLTFSSAKESLLSIKKFYKSVELPALVIAVTLAIILFIKKGVGFKEGWVHMKLTFSVLLIGVDVTFGWHVLKGKIKKNFFFILHALTLILLFLILFAIFVL